MTETLASASLVAVYSAMAVFALAFVLFTLDLARRGVAAGARRDRALVTVGGGSATDADSSERGSSGDESAPTRGPRYLRAAMALTILAWLVLLGGTVLRGVAAARVPWANMFEFTLTSVVLIVGVFLAVQFWQDLKYLGAFITGFATISLGVASVSFYVDVVPLPPALQSIWLVIHVFVASLAVGFLALGAALSLLQLIKTPTTPDGLSKVRFVRSLPSVDRLETLAYRLNIVGFVFWTFTLIAGAVWAERAWGRYWGWDTKEVWTFIIWVLYAGYIHARATRGWRGSRSAWLSIIGILAVIFNFTIVNVFFKGLHAYSGL